MSIDTVNNEQIIQLINDWYQEISARNLKRAKELKLEIECKFNSSNFEHAIDNLNIHYSLIRYRYQLLVEDFNEADRILSDIEPFQQKGNILEFYYQFFKAIHCTLKVNYSQARRFFEKAEKLLNWVYDPLEKAEYYYKVADYYYHVEQPLLALHNAAKAKETFEINGNEIKKAGCENILGLSCMLLKQFEEAEEHLLTGLDLVLKQNEEMLCLLFRYNLGLLYSEQNLTQVAITHLNEVYSKKFRPHKTSFLLAREHYKLHQADEAEKLIGEGIEFCSELGNEEYKHHLSLLHMFQNDFSEPILKEGISYFEKEELWGYIHEYTEKGALAFLKLKNHEKACEYFLSAYAAKQKLLEKGALK